MTKKLIVITGADGSGKSTLIKRLTQNFSQWQEVSIWDAMDANLFQTKKQIDTYLCGLSPNARTLFLAHALVESLAKAQKTDAQVLVANGYYFKYFASELALGADKELIDSLIPVFPKPDVVVKLEVDVDIAVQRKTKFTQYECGGKSASPEAFSDFQQKAATHWAGFNQQNWLYQSTIGTPEAVYDTVLKAINLRQL